jgi:hypothetical protein
MSRDITQLVMERYFINELEKEIANKNKELVARWEDLRKKCDHSTFKIDRNYDLGGYDYRNSVDIIHTCTICDKVIKHYQDPKHQGHYG